MTLEIFCLCDAATENGGKLNILGAFDRVWSNEAPAIVNHCAVAARVRFSRAEEGAHRLRITFADDDGQLVIPALESTLDIRLPGGELSVPVNFIILLPSLKLPRFGDYTIDLALDGNHLGSLPLAVRQVGEGARRVGN
jgi:hypothetical protein